MAVVCPFAEWRPLETAQREPAMAGHHILCFHTMVGYLVSTDGMFRSGGWDGTESHWGVGGIWGPDLGGGMDGRLYQWQDMLHQADANLDGNPTVLSVETADNATSPIAPWTPAQVDTLVRLGTWVCSVEAHAFCPSHWTCHQVGIPTVLIPDTLPGRRGIGYHRQGIEGSYPDGLVDGGVRWSNATGKVCPADARIHQLKTEVVPRIAAGEEDTLTPELKTYLDERFNALNGDLSGLQFMVGLLWDLNTPNGFRFVDPKTGQLVDKDTPGAKAVVDVWRWTRESAIQARVEPDQHAALAELIKSLHPQSTDTTDTTTG